MIKNELWTKMCYEILHLFRRMTHENNGLRLGRKEIRYTYMRLCVNSNMNVVHV